MNFVVPHCFIALAMRGSAMNIVLGYFKVLVPQIARSPAIGLGSPPPTLTRIKGPLSPVMFALTLRYP